MFSFGLGIGKMLVFDQKKKKKNTAEKFFSLLVIKNLDPDWIRIRIGFQSKMLDPDPYQMNPDPKPFLKVRQTRAASSASLSDSFPARSRTNSCRRFQATTCPRIKFL
jgi:hypothetical protein